MKTSLGSRRLISSRGLSIPVRYPGSFIPLRIYFYYPNFISPPLRAVAICRIFLQCSLPFRPLSFNNLWRISFLRPSWATITDLPFARVVWTLLRYTTEKKTKRNDGKGAKFNVVYTWSVVYKLNVMCLKNEIIAEKANFRINSVITSFPRNIFSPDSTYGNIFGPNSTYGNIFGPNPLFMEILLVPFLFTEIFLVAIL